MRVHTPARHRAALVGGALLIAAAACVPQDRTSEAASASGPVASEPPAVDVGDAAASGGLPTDLLAAIVADLVQGEQLRREDIVLLRGEPVIWPDGALGCPRPGEIYTQAEVPGYWVVLQAGDREYGYRAAGAGHFRRCDRQPGPVNRAPVD